MKSERVLKAKLIQWFPNCEPRLPRAPLGGSTANCYNFSQFYLFFI